MADARKQELARELKHRFYRIAQALRRESASSPLTTAQSAVLSLLLQGTSLRVSDLAKAEAVALPTMSQVINRMVDAGWVSRASPRGTYNNMVAITRKGRSVAARVAKKRDMELLKRLTTLSPKECEVLEKAIAVIDKIYDREPWKQAKNAHE